MGDLTTLTAVKSQLSIGTLNNVDDALLSTYVTQASQMIETYTKRTFNAENGTLTFDIAPPYIYGRKLFFREDVLGVYELRNGNGTVITADQYRFLPLNNTPLYGLELLPSASVVWSPTPAGDWLSAITLAGTLGYSTTPPQDIQLAATKLASWLYMNRDNSGEIVKFADGSTSIPAEAPAIVLRILNTGRYVRDQLTV
jgi:hypothetical protein